MIKFFTCSSKMCKYNILGLCKLKHIHVDYKGCCEQFDMRIIDLSK